MFIRLSTSELYLINRSAYFYCHHNNSNKYILKRAAPTPETWFLRFIALLYNKTKKLRFFVCESWMSLSVWECCTPRRTAHSFLNGSSSRKDRVLSFQRKQPPRRNKLIKFYLQPILRKTSLTKPLINFRRKKPEKAKLRKSNPVNGKRKK